MMNRLVNSANKYLKEYEEEIKIDEAVQGEWVEKAYDLVDEGLISRTDLYEIFLKYIGGNERDEFLEHIVRHYELSEGDYEDVYDLIDLIGEESAFDEMIRWLSNDEIKDALEMNELIFDEEEELNEGSPQKLKRYETPKDIPGVRGASAIGWKYDTNGNPVVVVELIKDGKGRNKSIQLASIEDGEQFESELKNDKELGKNLLNNLKDNLNKKDIKEEEELSDTDEETVEESSNYYSKELNRLNPIHTLKMQFRDEDTQTKWMDLNSESIDALETYLNAYKLILKDNTDTDTVEESSDEKETPKFRTVKITYDSGDEVTTDMSGKLTDEEIYDYFKVGRVFNIGSSEDKMVKVKKVDILENKNNRSVFDKHQEKIAIKTLKMSDEGANIMGGMTKQEARDFLKKIGYSEKQIQKLDEDITTESFLLRNANRFIV